MVERKKSEAWQIGDRFVICRHDASTVEQLNERVREFDRLPDTRSISLFPPKIEECVSVLDTEKEELYWISVRRLDCRPSSSPRIQGVVKFSKRCHAPFQSENIQLAIPEYYRTDDGLDPGVGDPQDSVLEKDLTPWAINQVGGFGSSVKANASFSSSEEPYIYCTSIKPLSDRKMKKMKNKVFSKYQYDAATEIQTPDAFAMQLGIDFALSVDKEKDVKLGGLEKLIYLKSSYTVGLWKGSRNIDKIVNVYHGPVHYEDQSGSVETQKDFFDPYGAERAWFTKKTRFSDQKEYRFAVSTPGTPTNMIFRLAISDEIRELMAEIKDT